MFFKLSSLMVAAILGSFGIIYSDMSLILAASLISPLMSIVGDIAKNLVKMNIANIFTNFATLLIMVIVAFLIGLRIQKIKNGSDEKEKNVPLLIHLFIGFVLGLFVTYISTLPKTSDILMQQIGVSVAIILLIPIVKIGLLLGQYESETMYSDVIENGKIIAANLIPFFVGATLVDMLVL